MNILVTGGAGYIGSTICSALIDAGHTPIILDNLAAGRKQFTKDRIFYEGDISDRALLKRIFEKHSPIYCAIHCAALIIVPESVSRPYDYYRENVYKSHELFKTLNDFGCHRIVFSSSASVYDDAADYIVTENSPVNARSPYARSKYMVEMILQDMCAAYEIKGLSLRYFNPIGADPKMRSGNQIKSSTHLVGKLLAAAGGLEEKFYLTGVDWPTRDGTAIKDYIHIWDLALAHVCAVERFDEALKSDEAKDGYLVINVGMGNGVTVREIIDAFKKIYTERFSIEEAPPRPGDVPGAYASIERAGKILKWSPALTIEDGIKDAMRWNEVRGAILDI